MNKAINAVMEEGVSVNRAAELFQVKRETLRNKVKGLHTMKKGGQTVFTVEDEESLATYVTKCAEWGFPLDTLMIRCVVKGYLDKGGKVVEKFKNNTPGSDWVLSFIKRNKLVNKPIRNMSSARAEVNRGTINKFFDNL